VLHLAEILAGEPSAWAPVSRRSARSPPMNGTA